MFFGKDKRQEIIKKQPELRAKVADVGRLIGAAWKKASVSDKTPYEKMAAEDKIRYTKELAAYKKKKGTK